MRMIFTHAMGIVYGIFKDNIHQIVLTSNQEKWTKKNN